MGTGCLRAIGKRYSEDRFNVASSGPPTEANFLPHLGIARARRPQLLREVSADDRRFHVPARSWTKIRPSPAEETTRGRCARTGGQGVIAAHRHQADQ